MGNITIKPEGIFVNLSPDAFHRWAEHFYKVKCDFQAQHKFSPVPYFLCCRALELELKAKHLIEKRQKEVKNEFGHHLIKAYDALSKERKVLSEEEYAVLNQAKEVYSSKGFEYINLEDSLTGYKRFPDLKMLDSLPRKILGYYA